MKASTYLQLAYIISQESKCVSWKVGAVIEKGGRIISTGYNGSPTGGINCCDHAHDQGWTKPLIINGGSRPKSITGLNMEFREHHNDWSSKHEIHAELNAIIFAARNGISIDGGTMYVTLSPCPDCAKAIAQSGIKKLVYAETYDRNVPGWDKILLDSGIEVIKYERSNLNHIDWSTITNYCGVK
ncbi:dCMP deaminase [Proteus phage PM2]|uniref:dCMP deaminase n=2 Tax=Bragavirus TaxID=2948639 RepID=A0A0G2SSB1_9CAUD|nr:dCMP deaminase [Proteus phage vB_PmiM_Pm5461]YP_010092079.1 dCMP deaminase [Proteus phage PM2]AKA62068.1 dCMP deaminase [Proteus phage vB_PmiM_Pm5461]ASZ76471.1 dCMP deaminase [Proteus phage PM2]